MAMRVRTYLDRVPEAGKLVEAGLRPTAAVRLARAGYTSLEKLAAATRDELLAIHGVSLGTVEACERLIGHPLPSPFGYWREQGLPSHLARVLCRAKIESVEALARLSYKEKRALGIGVVGMRECDAVLERSSSRTDD
jgi:hypothetical protein